MAQGDSDSKSKGFRPNQSAELVEEVRRRAIEEKSSQSAPNEMGQQPLQDEPKKGSEGRATPQQQRETPRKQAGF